VTIQELFEDDIFEGYELYNIETLFELSFWFVVIYFVRLYLYLPFIFLFVIVFFFLKNRFNLRKVHNQYYYGPLSYFDRYYN